jgi:hypothetical protein
LVPSFESKSPTGGRGEYKNMGVLRADIPMYLFSMVFGDKSVFLFLYPESVTGG